MANQLKIMILSGVREQGKDMFAVQVNDEIFVLDAGLKYPDSSLFGIDVVIPDMDDTKAAGTQAYRPDTRRVPSAFPSRDYTERPFPWHR